MLTIGAAAERDAATMMRVHREAVFAKTAGPEDLTTIEFARLLAAEIGDFVNSAAREPNGTTPATVRMAASLH